MQSSTRLRTFNPTGNLFLESVYLFLQFYLEAVQEGTFESSERTRDMFIWMIPFRVLKQCYLSNTSFAFITFYGETQSSATLGRGSLIGF